MKAEDGKPGSKFPVILMVMRFDGCLGFVGGFVDEGDKGDPLAALKREAEEEVGFRGFEAGRAVKITDGFFVHRVTRDELAAIEAGITRAQHFPSEVLGLVRVPPVGGWYDRRKDRGAGFSLRNFLSNKFVANSREQLLMAIRRQQWLDDATYQFVCTPAPPKY